MVTRIEFMEKIIEKTNQNHDLIIATTGYSGRELYAASDRKNHFYMVGSMGCAIDIGLGLSIQRPDKRVIVIDGDGAILEIGSDVHGGLHGAQKSQSHCS